MEKRRKRIFISHFCFLVLMCVSFIFGREISVSAEEKIKTWKTTYEEMRFEMEQEAEDAVKKWMSAEKKSEVEEKDWDSKLVSYDFKNAIPVSILQFDETMIADFKEERAFSKLIKWEDRWYVPVKTMADRTVSAAVEPVKGKYKVCAVYMDEDGIYIEGGMPAIMSQIEDKFGDEAEEVNIVKVPYYCLTLLYVQTKKGDEYIIPYQGSRYHVLGTIGFIPGEKYRVEEFISELDRHYEEYTKEELMEMYEKGLAGGGQPRLKVVSDKKPSVVPKVLVGITGMVVLVLLFVLFDTKRRRNADIV